MSDSTTPIKPPKLFKKDKSSKKTKKDKKDKKGKAAPEPAEPAAAPAPAASATAGGALSGFLFGVATEKDSGLDDIFKHSAGPSKLPPPPAVTTPAPAAPAAAPSSDKKRKAVTIASPASSKKAKPAAAADADDDDEVDDAALEEFAKELGRDLDTDEEEEVEELVDAGNEGEEVEEEAPAEKQGDKNEKTKAKKFVPADETPEQRDARTVFVGNVGVEVCKSKSLTKSLVRHLLSTLPSSAHAKHESIRFRSVAFSVPTSASQKSSAAASAAVAAATHGAERAKRYRDEVALREGKTYQNPREKRKAAFIKGELHAEAGSVNAYVVLAHPRPGAPEGAWHPEEVAAKVVENAHGTVFEGRTLRVDRVTSKAGKVEGKARVAWHTDPQRARRSLFVGGVDYAAKEEDVRAFFEALVVEERGQPEGKKAWVEDVRLIRDGATQMGKGFGYVLFVDTDSVDELLILPQEKLKLLHRKLRLSRCKAAPPPAPRTRPASTPSKAGTIPFIHPSRSGKPVPVPKGDPALGERLAGLSKDERKAAKASDAERLARRLAKKKARMGMEKEQGKEGRVRERKRKEVGGKSAGAPGKAKKARVRSAKQADKKNGRKA